MSAFSGASHSRMSQDTTVTWSPHSSKRQFSNLYEYTSAFYGALLYHVSLSTLVFSGPLVIHCEILTACKWLTLKKTTLPPGYIKKLILAMSKFANIIKNKNRLYGGEYMCFWKRKAAFHSRDNSIGIFFHSIHLQLPVCQSGSTKRGVDQRTPTCSQNHQHPVSDIKHGFS